MADFRYPATMFMPSTTRRLNIFVLGAGASADYGLPMWAELRDLLIAHIGGRRSETSSDISATLLAGLFQVGENKKYETIDKMISEISKKTANLSVLEELFKSVKEIFKLKLIDNKHGWIETFIEKNNLNALLDTTVSNNDGVFINFNYDDILVSRIVTFFDKEHTMTAPEVSWDWRTKTGRDFEDKFSQCLGDVFHPHGMLYLFEKDSLKIGEKTYCRPVCETFRNAEVSINSRTGSSVTHGGDSAISCHDTQEAFTFSKIKERIKDLAYAEMGTDVRLILLGVGPSSLELNLDKVFGDYELPIREIHYTCTDIKNMPVYEKYFRKFGAMLLTNKYENCRDLVEGNVFL